MASRVVLPDNRVVGKHSFRDYAALRAAVDQLQPDGAILVTWAGAQHAKEGTRDGVMSLRRALNSRFAKRGLAFIEDFKTVGVWIYRPVNAGPGNGRAIGPAKEDEIRSRPLED